MCIDNSESNFYFTVNSEACDTQLWTRSVNRKQSWFLLDVFKKSI